MMLQQLRIQRWLPVLLTLIVTAGVLSLWQALITQDQLQIKRTTELKASSLHDHVMDNMQEIIYALDRMARRWELRGQPPRKEWEEDANLYLKHYIGFRSIEWIDASLHPQWVMGQAVSTFAPPSEQIRQRVLHAAKEKKAALFSQVIGFPGGDKGFLVCIPLFPGNEFGGVIVATFQSQELIEALLHSQLEDLGYAVTLLNGDSTIYQSSLVDSPHQEEWRQEALLQVPGTTWRLHVSPTETYLTTMHSELPGITLALGLMMALTLGMATYFAQAAWLRKKDLENSNAELIREISERKRAQEAEECHAAELARSNADLQQFAYVASHDLQEPLRIVSGYVQLLAKRYRGKIDTEADEFIGYAVDAATRMQTLISDLLAYSRVGSRQKDMTMIDCERVLAATLANLKTALEESDARVTHDPLPGIHADLPQISQLFQNLIGNAIKYRGSDPPLIHISAKPREDEWLFSVADNGIGMDPKYSERIFVIFQRLHGKGQYSGTGIGLAICKKVVENHGGRIWVESQPGKGSTFYFTFPNKRD